MLVPSCVFVWAMLGRVQVGHPLLLHTASFCCCKATFHVFATGCCQCRLPIGSSTANSSNAVPCGFSYSDTMCVLVHEQSRAGAPTLLVCCGHRIVQCVAGRGARLHTHMAMPCAFVTSYNRQCASLVRESL